MVLLQRKRKQSVRKKEVTRRSLLSNLTAVPRAFYLQPTLQVAKQLIAKYLVRRVDGSMFVGKIVEVEAYLGEDDPASHAFNGQTTRNEVMFWDGGHLYVYFTYGMHFCCNVVTRGKGIGHAVLLRAVEPIEGLERMARNRGIELASVKETRNLCNGPAKLCEAFGIARKENGADLCGRHAQTSKKAEIWIGAEKDQTERHIISRSTRVGIARGKEHKWRFYLKGNLFVSKGKPSLIV